MGSLRVFLIAGIVLSVVNAAGYYSNGYCSGSTYKMGCKKSCWGGYSETHVSDHGCCKNWLSCGGNMKNCCHDSEFTRKGYYLDGWKCGSGWDCSSKTCRCDKCGKRSNDESCGQDSDCHSGFCYGKRWWLRCSGVCRTKLPDGSRCNRHSNCASGTCRCSKCGYRGYGEKCRDYDDCQSDYTCVKPQLYAPWQCDGVCKYDRRLEDETDGRVLELPTGVQVTTMPLGDLEIGEKTEKQVVKERLTKEETPNVAGPLSSSLEEENTEEHVDEEQETVGADTAQIRAEV